MLLTSIIGLGMTYGIAYTASHSKHPYKKAYWVYETAHFAAGIFVAMFFANFVVNPWQIVCLTIAIGFAWEVAEYLISGNARLKKILRINHVTLPDTLLDLGLDALGAIVFVLFL